jgi:hypothetical protein
MEKLKENIVNCTSMHQKNLKSKILNEISVSGTRPAEGNSATVIQTYIKGDRKDPNNYKLIN